MTPHATPGHIADPSRYRPDIDGLRAVAVIAVVLFHLEVPPFTGGFVGVDVFFVISGFLITRLILDQRKTGAFSFANFYLRRTRRLFPALAATIAGVLVAGTWFMTPGDLDRVGGSALFSILSLSNFYFWIEKGYFDAAAQLKPLLHTWSLSVEEQFYLVWPALLVFTAAKLSERWVVALIALGAAASLLLNHVFIDRDTAIFFLSPFRAFEFAIGALLVWVRWQPRAELARDLILALGLGLIAVGVFGYSEHTPFPTAYALVPCLGAAMVIHSGQARRVGRVLDNRWMARIGLISYSLYLAHWPVIVFYRYAMDGAELGVADTAVAAALSFALAGLLHRFVETPFRAAPGPQAEGRLPASAFVSSCAGIALALGFVGANVWTDDGWPWRLSPAAREVLASIETPAGDLRAQTEAPRYRVALVGDSHAGRFASLLSDYFVARDTELVALVTCLPLPAVIVEQPSREGADCARKAKALTRLASDFDAVILASRWAFYTETTPNLREPKNQGSRQYLTRAGAGGGEPLTLEHTREVFTEALAKLTDELEAASIPLLILGQVPPVGSDLSRCETLPRWREREQCVPLYSREQALERIAFAERSLAAAARSPLVRFVSFADLLCPDAAPHCRTRMGDNFLYSDDNHFSPLGARVVGAQVQPAFDDFVALFRELADSGSIATTTTR